MCILKQGKRVLSGFQTLLSGKRRAKPGALPVVTVVCLVLLTLLAVVQVAHVHPVDTDGDHCPLCIVMHSAAPVAMTAAVVILIELAAEALAVPDARAIIRYWHPTLFTRPPPVGLLGV